jgi:HlyD family secretion protein
MKKRIIIPTAVLILAVAAFLIFFRGTSKKYEFRFDKVSQGDITMYVTATGTINPVISVEVGTQVSGIINKLYADFNSVVKEGQVIAQIDPTFLQQSVRDASASLDRAKAQYADAKRVMDRTKSLFDKGLESQANYDAALTQYESNQAQMKQAEASLERAKINLAYATIYAPINGVVIDRKVNVGQTVAASFSSPTLYTIANDLQKMQVQTTIDESDIGRISIGQEATFTVDAYPDDRFRGTVSQIRLAPVSVQNVVNYTVVIDVNNNDLKLMPGMTANVRILVGSSSNVLRVPNLALRFQPPADLVDSTKVKGMMEGGPGTGGPGGMRRGDFGSGEGRGGENRGGGGTGDRRAMMKALRDSIVAAHGGQMSEEDLRVEMRKVFEKMPRPAEHQAVPAPAPKTFARAAQGSRFGIQNNFPEYQKSAYVPQHQALRGRVWMLNSSGKLEPVVVTTGLSDGRFTEVTTESLKPGDQLVLGASSNSDVATGPTANPLAPSGGRPMGGGGPR